MSLQAAYFRHSTLVCANSAYSADEVVRLTGRSDNVRVLSPPVVPSAATPRAPVSNRMLFAGRITREKGLSDLIRAMVDLPQVHLVVAGDGPERATVAGLAAELGVGPRVEWLGWVDQASVDAAIQQSSLVVMPSLWAETFGLAGIQAAMNRRPIVAYDSGGIRDWLTPDMGILVRAGDVPGLAAGIDALTRDPVRAARLGDAAFARAQSYLPERHGVSLEVLLQDACARWRAPR
jgi:glycosyltransferase involved in cell wall biosynthesis